MKFPILLVLLCSSAASATASPPDPRHRPARRPAAAADPVTAANRAATVGPVRDGFVNATAVYPFEDGAIYRVVTAPGRVTDIMLQPGETLGAVASGDTARWVIGDTTSGNGAEKRTHVLVKPFASGLATNLVIATDRRTYHVSLTSGPTAAMASISWSYPLDALIAYRRAVAEAEAKQPIAQGIDAEALRFDYAITGDRPAWRPLRAFDDGRQTFIEFSASIAVGEAPPLFLIDARGEAQLVNYRLRRRYYVVDRLFDAAELRLGGKRQTVVRITRQAPAAPGRAS